MARLRYNGLTATLGAALTSSATSVTFGAALTHAAGSVPTIASPDYLPLTILDSSGNVSEIVSLTAYTSGATTGTISRAQEGTTGVAHSSGDKVVHGPSVLDIQSGALVAVKSYSPATAVTLSTTATGTIQDVDATNLAVTFNAPVSGQVLVRLCGIAQNSATNAYPHWFLVEGTTAIAGRWIFYSTASNHALVASSSFLITGLTPGSSHTYKWAHATDVGVLSLSAGGANSLAGSGPAVMEVWAA